MSSTDPSNSATRASVVTPRTSAETLWTLIRDCLHAVGLPDEDARATADVLVDANLRGIDSHGFHRLPIYMRRIATGIAFGTERLSKVATFGPLCRLDAHHALGPAGAVKATDVAADLARRHAIGLVALGRSGHFGCAGFYARRLARDGLVGIVMSNGPANMAPHGSCQAFLGTSAFAIAAPLGRHDDFSLDMSASTVARGKIIREAALERLLEPGLAIDAEGTATTNAAAALAGSVLPVGGPKGSGLALAISILCVLLAGADCDDEMAAMHRDADVPQNVGHLFLAIDPWRVADRDLEVERLDRLIDRLHSLRRVAGVEQIRFAGEGSARRARERLEHGIPLEPLEVAAARQVCLDCGLPELADRVCALDVGRLPEHSAAGSNDTNGERDAS